MRRQKRKKKTFYTGTIVFIVCIFVVMALVESMVLNPPLKINMEELDSQYAYLMDVKSGWKVAEKNGTEKMYPASITKIMTAVLALEHYSDLDTLLTVPSDIFSELYAESAALAGFQAGEQATVRDILYGVMLPSGAECCLTIAYSMAGSEEAFADLMNQKASKVGMKNTHFMNCTGLHDEEHYSTAKDMAKLLSYALNYKSFREIFTSREHTTAATNVHPSGFTFYSTMFKNLGDGTVTGGKILGGKTGNTGMAGLCLASLAEVNGREYILVTGKAEDFQGSNVQDAVNVYNQVGEGETISIFETIYRFIEPILNKIAENSGE